MYLKLLKNSIYMIFLFFVELIDMLFFYLPARLSSSIEAVERFARVLKSFLPKR